MQGFVTTFEGWPADTIKITTPDDTAQAFSAAQIGSGCTGATITVEDQSMRFTFGSTPTNAAGTGLGHLMDAGDTISLNSGNAVKKFKWINNVAGSDAVLIVTFYRNKAS